FFSSRRRHTRSDRDWSSDVCSSDLLVLADESQVASAEAQVATAKVSLDQAVSSHQAGTAPLLDELRARVDYQTLEQQLIVAQNRSEERRVGKEWRTQQGAAPHKKKE